MRDINKADLTSCQCMVNDDIDITVSESGDVAYDITGCCGGCYVLKNLTHCCHCGTKLSIKVDPVIFVDHITVDSLSDSLVRSSINLDAPTLELIVEEAITDNKVKPSQWLPIDQAPTGQNILLKHNGAVYQGVVERPSKAPPYARITALYEELTLRPMPEEWKPLDL